MRPRKPAALPRISEAEFSLQVSEYARLVGYRGYHTADSRRSEPGFPDWVFVRPYSTDRPGVRGRIVHLELKVHPYKPTVAQLQWIDDINAAGGIAAVFYPDDWDELVKLLD